MDLDLAFLLMKVGLIVSVVLLVVVGLVVIGAGIVGWRECDRCGRCYKNPMRCSVPNAGAYSLWPRFKRAE